LNPEILTLLDPKSVRLEYAGFGKAEITRMDVNAAMAGADETGLNLLLAHVCNDRKAQSQAFYSLYNRVMTLAMDQGWQFEGKRGQERIRALTQLALFEHTDTPRCPACKGTKYNRAMRPCKACKGTGYYKIKDSHRARAMGINRTSWSRLWAKRYADVLQIISEAEYLAMRNIRKSLTER
jgi:hypothetical protein